jgi:peptide/nickel transport system permease protein
MRPRTALFLALGWLGLLAGGMLLAPALSVHQPSQVVAGPLLSPSEWSPMGTDELGRDEWSRFLYGGRTTIIGSLAAAALAISIGTTAAMVAQGLGGPVDATVAGGSGAALAIPSLLLALLVVAILGPGVDTLVVAVGLGLSPGFARLARSALRRERGQPYVTAAAALGSGRMETARRHLLPNALPALLSLATTHYAWAIGGLTTLTFLGLAGEISTPEWGAMLNAARAYLRVAPWLALFPGAAIAGTILAVHGLGAWAARLRPRG